MMKDNKTNAIKRQVHFANGFPPKGLVQAAPLYRQSAYTVPVKHYVSLDEVSPGRVRRTHRTIPPLAMGRGQFCSMKDRPEDERYKRRPDPFKLPKAAEKTGFSASQIKHAKPRMLRACRSTEPSSPPATAPMYNLKNVARRTVHSTPPNRPLESDVEDDFVPPTELKPKNSKIISDVEKESIQAELAGLEEVYQRVCHGKLESLYSLLYPSRRDTKRGPVQYTFINTSAPVQLRTPKITQNSKKSPAAKDGAQTNDIKKSENEEQGSISPPDLDTKQENKNRPILIPLPYIRSDVSLTTPIKQHTPTYHVPYIYSSRNTKAVTRPSHAPNSTTVPAVINFNPMNIPELNCPGTKNGTSTRGVVTVTNKTDINAVDVDPEVSVVRNSIPVPFVSPMPFKGTTPNQTPALFDGKLDIESVDSEIDYPTQLVKGSLSDNGELSGNCGDNGDEEEKDLNHTESNSGKNLAETMVINRIRLSVTTVGGLEDDVEIYDYDKRDIEGEQQAAKHLVMEEIGERKIKEYNELLEEHQHILDEVQQLEKELHKEEIE